MPSQARAALGSAAAAAGELARASGADEAGVAEARRATLLAAQVRRIGETIGRDPARAAKILEEEGGVLPDAQRARLSREVELEQARVDANQAAARMAGEHPDLVDDLDGFLAGMEAAAGKGAHRIEAFRAAGIGAWRAARAARETMESQAWAAVSPLLEPASGIHSWTQLPADLWRSLSERQQRAVKARLASPWADSDSLTLSAIRSRALDDTEAFREADLMAYALELKPEDMNRALLRQAVARAGGSDWEGERQALREEWGIRSDPASGGLIRTSAAMLPPDVYPGPMHWEEEHRAKERAENARKAAAKPFQPKPPTEPDINWEYIRAEENGRNNDGTAKPPKTIGCTLPVGKSSVTIASGVDIGQKSVREVQEWGLKPTTFAKLRPFINAKDKGAALLAEARRKKTPLVVTPEEAEEIDRASHQWELARLVKAFDRDSKIGSFAALPRRTQTVLMSVYMQHGTSDPAADTPNFWRFVTTGDWASAYVELMDFGDATPNRRKRDAALLQQDIDAGLLEQVAKPASDPPAMKPSVKPPGKPRRS